MTVEIPGPAKRPAAKEVITDTLKKYGVSADDLFSGRRGRTVVEARREICWRLVVEKKYPKSIVAACLNLERTTVVHHVQFYEERRREADA